MAALAIVGDILRFIARRVMRAAALRSTGFACYPCLMTGEDRRGVSRMDPSDGLYVVCEDCRYEYIQRHIRRGLIVME